MNRGGLWAVSREIQELYREAELEFRNATLSMVTTKINIDLIVNKLLSNSKLIDIFNTIIEGCELQTRDKTTIYSTFQTMLDLYLKVRAHSYAKDKVNMYRMKPNVFE